MPKPTLAVRGAAIIVLGVLSGCGQIELPSFPFGGSSNPSQLALYGGSIIAAGPDAYCVDTQSSRPESGFAAIAPCATINDNSEPPTRLAFITLQVGGDASAFGAEISQLSELLSAPDALGDVTDLETEFSEAEQAVITLYRGPSPDTTVKARALFDMGNRSATITVSEITGAALSFDAAEELLVETLGKLRSANATIVASSE